MPTDQVIKSQLLGGKTLRYAITQRESCRQENVLHANVIGIFVFGKIHICGGTQIFHFSRNKTLMYEVTKCFATSLHYQNSIINISLIASCSFCKLNRMFCLIYNPGLHIPYVNPGLRFWFGQEKWKMTRRIWEKVNNILTLENSILPGWCILLEVEDCMIYAGLNIQLKWKIHCCTYVKSFL